MATTGQGDVNATIVNSTLYDNHAGDNNSSDSEDFLRGLEVFKMYIMYGFLPICVVGLVANSVSVWVWTANKKHNPMVLLFQCLGAMDILYLLLSLVRGILYSLDMLPPDRMIYMIPPLYLSQTLSLHCTVIIGVIRWLAIARPHRMKHMSRRHIWMTCGVVGAWCCLMGSLVVVMAALFRLGEIGYVIMDGVLEVIMFVLPTLILLGFSISLLHITFKRQRQHIMTKRRKTTMAVLCIAGCACLTYVVGMNLLFLAAMIPDRSDSGCNWSCVNGGFAVALIVFVFNSSINFVFYFFFASKFRHFLKQTVGRCLVRLGRRQDFSPTSQVESTDTAENTQSSHRHHKDDKDCIKDSSGDLSEDTVEETKEAATKV